MNPSQKGESFMIPTTGLFSSRVSPDERNDEYLNLVVDFKSGKPFSFALKSGRPGHGEYFFGSSLWSFGQFLEDDSFGNFETRQVLPAKTDQFSFTD